MSSLGTAESRIAEIERRLRALECGLMHYTNEQPLDGDAKTVSGFTYEVMTIQDQIKQAKDALEDHRTDLDRNWTRLERRQKQNEQDGS